MNQAEGSITGLDLKQQPPTLVIQGKAGQSWNFTLDLKATRVLKNGLSSGLSELAPGEQVKVHYTQQGAMQVAKSIEITPVPKAAPSTQEGASGQK